MLFLLLFIQACWQSKGKNIPDVSNINVAVEIKDFNQQLFSIDTNDIRGGISELQRDFPAFFDLYFYQIVPIRKAQMLDDAFFQTVKDFLTDKDIRELADTTAIVFPNLKKYEQEFEDAFKYYKYYFPDATVPKIYPLISGFNYASFIFPIQQNQDGLGVGLDMLLGKDYPYWQLGIQNPAFSNYLTRSWTPEHLVKKTLDPLVDDMVALPKGDRLLDLIIYNGKKMYITDQLLPTTPDSIKWEYSSAQTQWVKNNEIKMWSYFLSEELLYETSVDKIKKLVDQSPSSPGMPKEAPGRTGNYLGFRIVEAFYEKKSRYFIGAIDRLRCTKDS
ncbi:MAG: hypothetical protein AAF573_17455 [Bacteroidota bacterium]